jgi:hypothetical protein
MTQHALLVTKILVNFVNNEPKKVARWLSSTKMAVNVSKKILDVSHSRQKKQQ